MPPLSTTLPLTYVERGLIVLGLTKLCNAYCGAGELPDIIADCVDDAGDVEANNTLVNSVVSGVSGVWGDGGSRSIGNQRAQARGLCVLWQRRGRGLLLLAGDRGVEETAPSW